MADTSTPTKNDSASKSDAVGSDTVVASKGGVELTQAEHVLFTVTPTVEDKNGMERIVGPSLDNWQSAPVEATDEQKKNAKERELKAKLAREVRLDSQAVNSQADDGSVTSTS